MQKNLFVTKEVALKLNDMKFKVGSRVRLNKAGKEEWGSQAPNGTAGTVVEIEPLHWTGEWEGNDFSITIDWDHGKSNCYPEEALKFVFESEYTEEKSIIPEPKETFISKKSDFFKEEKDISLEDMITKYL